ncbi:hypothetical protein DSL72_006242 [Monilinia vaccinii-corymbosi]|uniref:BTB domain-containing protein n=1 Tax=Monilinia vaccinii-corymbosi TaxID=61207 RepID=A0A8A3PNF7_9HELO|nr:hypothetical protein DSL72_006242 [Monilinia vaccinii-corymbosi]
MLLWFPKLKKFIFPGQTPDTRFILFGETEIHAHPIILKARSAFFRKFLDSPDAQPAEELAAFQYEWVSEIEEDGTWHLVEKSHAKPNDNKLSENKVKATEILTFIEMLNALYRIPYKLYADRLILVAEMAEYYCCLPAVSRNLYCCFSMSDNNYVKRHAVPLLDVAYKLRQPLLFKDCMIHVAGSMPGGSRPPPRLSNPKIREVMMKARGEIYRRIAECQQEIFNNISPDEENIKLLGSCWSSGSQIAIGPLSLPQYYRLLYSRSNDFALHLKRLLQCELQLPSSYAYISGLFNDHFYCARLSDEQLPGRSFCV